jgi:hypothetical protein
MIIYWNTRKKNGVPLTSVDPLPSNVKKGIQYVINGVLKIGTYVPGFLFGTSQNNLPSMDSGMCDWFVPMVFTTIQKTRKNFKIIEVPTETNFKGVWQPLSARQVSQKPEGQRAWSWFLVHSCTTLILLPDEVIIYKGIKYRVKAQTDYSEYGYIEYHLILDYTGVGT